MNLAEKYRPKTFEELINQDHIKKSLKALVKAVKEGRADLPHMLFVGPAGVGKTTVAYIIGRELNIPVIELNASDERGIDVVRGKIKRLAFSVGRRLILLDEADSMTEDAQHALRRIMEKVQERTGTRFILTCNYEWKIIDPIKSRCAIYRFEPLPKEEVLKRLIYIIKSEGVKVRRESLTDLKEALKVIIEVSRGDMRKALNLLETVLSSKVEITPENVRSMIAPNTLVNALEKALEGDLQASIRLLEDSIIMNKLDVEATVNQLYDAIKSLNVKDEVKAHLWMELARAEHAMKEGGSPLIQLSSVLACAWVKGFKEVRK